MVSPYAGLVPWFLQPGKGIACRVYDDPVSVARSSKHSSDHFEDEHYRRQICDLLVERVQDYAIFILDTDGRIRSWNEGAQRIKGYAKDEMTGHGFRSMASTLLHEQGWNHQVIERQLAHAERNAVSAAYNFAEHLPERRRMMQAWADYLDALRARAEVIPLFRKA